MSVMKRIATAAGEIDTADADAVQQLADNLAAEDYAPIVARTSDTIRRIVWSQTSLGGGACDALADRIATEIHAADVAVRSDAIAHLITEGFAYVDGDDVRMTSDDAGEPLECDECGTDDGARWDMPDGRAVCDGCNA